MLDISDGPRILRHQIIHLFSVLMSLCDSLLLFNLLCLHWGKWVLVLPAHPRFAFVLSEV